MDEKRTQREETKLDLRNSEVSITPEGHVLIKDPALVRKLAAENIDRSEALASDGVSVGVVVSKSF